MSNKKSELMLGGNVKLYPVQWKVGYSKGQNRFIIEAKQLERSRMPNASVQLVLFKDHFKALVKYLSEKLSLYEEKERKIDEKAHRNVETAMTLWEPHEVYWRD